MKILYYGNIIYGSEEFKQKVLNKEYIDGIVISTIMSKDGQMVIASLGNEQSIIESIENYSYEQTKEGTIILLETVLNMAKDVNQRILINAVITPPLLNFRDIDRYTDNLSSILNKYSNVDVSVFSSNYALITYLKPKLRNTNTGILLSPNNANYIDVDFYIFPPVLLATPILNQQFQNGKEIMILLKNWNELNQMNQFFTDIKNKTRIPRSLIDSISVLTMYPEITFNTIKNI